MNYLFIAFEGIAEGLGTGHVVRIKNLINLLSNNQETIIKSFFVTNQYSSSDQYNLILADSFDSAENASIKCIEDNSIDFVIFDCLDYCQDLYQYCKDKNIITMGIDTSSNKSQNLDILINPVIPNKYSSIKGPMYSVHHEVEGLNSFNYSLYDKSIFICFGGIDYRQHAKKIIPFLGQISGDYVFKIITSDYDIVDSHSSFPENVEIYSRPKNFFELLKQSTLAIISGGVLFQESMYLGIPAFIIPQYKHQEDNAKDKVSNGLALGFSSISPEYQETCLKVNEILKKPGLMQKASEKGRAADDGFGAKRLAHMLKFIDYLEWDTTFFEIKIYSLNTKSYRPSVKKKLDAIIKRDEIDLIYFLCPSKDKESIKYALDDGFIKVDKRVTYQVERSSFLKIPAENNVIVKRSLIEHSDEISSIAANTEWTTRYVNDEKFPKEKIKDFYREWIMKSIIGDLDDMVFHLEYDENILGFISIRKNGINSGSIGLVAISDEAQGKGYGQALASHAVEHLIYNLDCASVDVVTQDYNVGACKTYERIGFKVSEKSIWMHKWI
tara:strand:- start:2607 stop:4271 length:1665 start_codon:yes stop_codon:yes gene_type:complete